MKLFSKVFFLIVIFSASSSVLVAQDILNYVHPNIGTAHSRWFFYTPAALPHGMAKLAPSTNGHYGNPSGWEAVGYDARHNSIEGFVHFHEWQVGGVSIMPATGPLKVIPGELENPGEGYRSHFDRKNEIAKPGYYKVLLDDYNITAELTATKRVGFHKYTFPKSDESRIIFDIGNVQGESGPVTDASIQMTDDTHFEGYVITNPKYVQKYDEGGRVAMYFFGEVNRKPSSTGAFDASGIHQQAKAANGKGAGLFIEYKTEKGDVIELKVGLSYTSVANAKNNLMTEASILSFEQAHQQATKIWQHELSKLKVESNNEDDKVKFYTGLFHGLLGRGIASDVNGDYPRHDGTIGHLPVNKNGGFKYEFYNTDAIWGAFWNLTQLWALAYPEHYTSFIQTQLEIYKQRGWFGDGIANSNFVSGVGTNFVGLTIAAAYNIGLRNFDIPLAYEAVKKNELGYEDRPVGSGKTDLKIFLEKKYSPTLEEDKTNSTGSQFGASHTLEYSFSTFAAAQMAKGLGHKDDYKKLIAYANGWSLIFDPKDKLTHPRNSNGKFIDRFDPHEPWRGFQEGNAIQYTYYVPHNPAGLINKIGKDNFNFRLNTLFDTAQKYSFGGGTEINAFAGIKSVYNHGNQPDLHLSWLFNFSGKPWLTQKWTRAICNEFYGVEQIHGYGYGQDEDQGQLGSWYVMASLGLFDVKGFTDSRPIIEIGSPLFSKASIRLGNGKKLTINAKNNGKTNVYIQSAMWNGRPLNNCWMYRDDLMKGGTLEFVMGSTPNKNWGVKIPPPSVQ
ncbi:MAG: GH92 family glycosyl hydrolase [Ginsengibacter sp.]